MVLLLLCCYVMNLALPLAPELLAQLPEPLRLVVLQLVEQLQNALSQIQSLTAENQLLRQKLDALIRRYFGSPKNETLDPNQLLLLLAGLTQTPAPVPAMAVGAFYSVAEMALFFSLTLG